jgi:hypothetical protein
MNKLNPDIKLMSSKLVFIGGVTRSGKSFLCPIASSFKNFEMFFMSSIAENISYIDRLKKIDSKYSSFLFKLIFNEIIYNLNIGRNLNQRKTDYTSISNFKNPKMYYDRMKNFEGDEIIKKIDKEKNSYPVMFHDPLINPELILNSFPDSKIIFVDRHPVELIDEWIKKKYSSNFYKNPRNVTLTIKYKNQNFPYWCKKKINKIYHAKNEYIKTIYSLSELVFQQKTTLKNLNKKLKKRILLIKFDQLVQNTNFEINKAVKFLNCKISKKTKKTINKQKGNRKINYQIREKKKQKILELLDKESLRVFSKLEKNYNEN